MFGPSFRHLPLLLLSLSSLSLAWYYGDQRPYGQPDTPPPPYAQSQSASDNGYERGPPPRVSTGYGDTGTGPGYDTWNRGERPMSQFDYIESDRPSGNVRTENLECGKDLYVSPNQIIDIQSSVQFGAQLLDGIYSYSFDGCVNACCEYDGCDLALYKTDGVSQTGKTCYFVHCGLPDHCRMVENEGFKAGFLFSKPDYGVLLDDHTAKQDEQSQGTPEVTHSSHPPFTPPVTTSTPPVTSSTPPVTTLTTAPPTTQNTPNEATPTEAVVVSPETTEGPDSMTTPVSTHSTTDMADEDKENTVTTPKSASPTRVSAVAPSVAPSNTPPSPSTQLQKTDDGGAVDPPTSKIVIDNATNDPKTTDDYDECARNGCDGSGLIAVSIVGTIIIIVLLVVAAVVTVRIYKLKTRRQYRNVDYLINGMYT